MKRYIKNIPHSLIFGSISLLGILFLLPFLIEKTILRNADGFAYIRMAEFLKDFSSQGFGTGWFGFVYSFLLAPLLFFFEDSFFAAKILNLILLGISGYIFYKVALLIFSRFWAYISLFFFYIASGFLPFRTEVLSENIYIPLFLLLFFVCFSVVENFQEGKKISGKIFSGVLLGCLVGLLYLTRAEAFIYIGSIGIIALGMLFQRKISGKDFLMTAGIFFISFFCFISPYIFHLHNITGEWGLTNKGASNLRQAELRGIDRMDDTGFEKAVAELTADNKHLISGFAGGMKYDSPNISGSLKQSILEHPGEIFQRIIHNQKKVFILNIPEIFLGKSLSLYTNDARFHTLLFPAFLSIPLIILVFGTFKIFQENRKFFVISLSFFLPAFLFFTLFFTLNRYFIIFLPILILCFISGIKHISKIPYGKFLSFIFLAQFFFIQCLSGYSTYAQEKGEQELYALKKQAGIWLGEKACGENLIQETRDMCRENLGIFERFPIVTYYAGASYRWITPYTDSLKSLQTYAQYHKISYLVVDSMDFLEYRPELSFLLEESNIPGFSLIREFQDEKGRKVRLFFIDYSYTQ